MRKAKPYLTICTILLLAGCINPAPHKVRFLKDACIKPYERYQYLTCEPLRVSIDGKVYEVPAYFVTDLASIPRWYWSVLAPSYSSIVYPAILHDYFYSCRDTHVSRRFADDVFYASLLSEGISKFTAIKMYLAVRLFGRMHCATKAIPPPYYCFCKGPL